MERVVEFVYLVHGMLTMICLVNSRRVWSELRGVWVKKLGSQQLYFHAYAEL